MTIKNSDITKEQNEKNKYTSLKKLASEIIRGRKQIHHLISEAERGRIMGGQRNVEATCLIGTSKGTDLSDTSECQALYQEQLIEDYAKHEKIWYEYEDQIKNKWDRIDNKMGAEAEVYLEKDGIFVIKVMHYINSDTPLEFLDNRISLHNALFPDTQYELIGFTKTKKGFAFIIKQPYIKGRETKIEDNLSEFMAKAGFSPEKIHSYGNNVLKIEDLHEANVLKGKDDRFYFIDTISSLNNKSLYESFEIFSIV